MSTNIFTGCVPALMTPCNSDRSPNFDALVKKGRELMAAGMNGVVYCGSMGDWPLLTDAQRQEGVKRLVDAGVRVIVGTGAQNTASATAHAAHAQEVGADGLMVIPRVLSRGTSTTAQRNHFASILAAAPDIPAVIYNSPYYGFETKAPLFFDLRKEFSSLVGFKEFGDAESLSYAAENITSADDEVVLMVGVDTQVFHGFLHCGSVCSVRCFRYSASFAPDDATMKDYLRRQRAMANAEATDSKFCRSSDSCLFRPFRTKRHNETY